MQLFKNAFLVMMLVGMALPVFAQREAALPEVVVTATRVPTPFEETLADVSVITEEEIEKSGASTLGDLLRRQPGIEVARNGGPAALTSLFMRGTNSGHVLILVDGVRTASASTGATSLEAIPLSEIERIEIVRGAASSLYGADALGGVVQIFTKRGSDKPLSLSGDVAYGSDSTSRGGAHISGNSQYFRWSFGFGNENSHGFNAINNPQNYSYNPDRDGYRKDHQSASLEFTPNDAHRLTASFLRSALDTEIDAGSDDDERTKTDYSQSRLGGSHQLASFWTTRWQYAEMRNDSKSRSWGETYSYKTRETQYLWQNELDVPLGVLSGTLLLAFEHNQEKLRSSTDFDKDKRNTNAVVTGYRWQHGKHALQLSGRYDHSSQYGGETTGGVNYGYAPTQDWKVVLGVANAFKAPTFNDLYFPGFANPDLAPEKARTLEAGIRNTLRHGDLSGEWRVTGWENRIRQMIVFTCDSAGMCRPENVNRARLRGVTLAADFDWRGYGLQLSMDRQSPKDRESGLLLPRRAKTHGSMTLSRHVGAFYGAVNVQASGSRYDDAANNVRLGGYGVVNLVAEWTMKLPHETSLTWFAHVDNLFDRDYAQVADYNTGGLQAMIGIRGRFH